MVIAAEGIWGARKASVLRFVSYDDLPIEAIEGLNNDKEHLIQKYGKKK